MDQATSRGTENIEKRKSEKKNRFGSKSVADFEISSIDR